MARKNEAKTAPAEAGIDITETPQPQPSEQPAQNASASVEDPGRRRKPKIYKLPQESTSAKVRYEEWLETQGIAAVPMEVTLNHQVSRKVFARTFYLAAHHLFHIPIYTPALLDAKSAERAISEIEAQIAKVQKKLSTALERYQALAKSNALTTQAAYRGTRKQVEWVASPLSMAMMPLYELADENCRLIDTLFINRVFDVETRNKATYEVKHSISALAISIRNLYAGLQGRYLRAQQGGTTRDNDQMDRELDEAGQTITAEGGEKTADNATPADAPA